MRVRTAYPLIVNNKVVANGIYEGGFDNASGKGKCMTASGPCKPRRRGINPDESPSDVQARNLIDGASYFDGDTMNSYADGKGLTETTFPFWQVILIGTITFLAGTFYEKHINK